MKKVICVMLSILISSALGGCAEYSKKSEAAGSITGEKDKNKSTTKTVIRSDFDSNLGKNEYIDETPDFFNDTISVSPKHIYYDSGRLIVNVYIHNRFADSITNIDIDYMGLSDIDGRLIAEAGFTGTLDGIIISPDSYYECNINFPEDYVFIDNADLSALNYNYDVSFSY